MKKYLFVIEKRTWQLGHCVETEILEFENDEAARIHAEKIHEQDYGYSAKVTELYLIDKNLV